MTRLHQIRKHPFVAIPACALFVWMLGCVVSAQAAERFSVLTGPTGGAYYTMGSVWGEIAGKKAGFEIAPEIGKAGKGSLVLIDSKEAHFAVLGDAVSYEGYQGVGWSEDKKYSGIRSVLPLSNGYFQLWTRSDQANARSVKDLNGRKLGLGAPASLIDVWGRRVLQFFSIKDYRIVNASHGQLGSMMADGLIDGHATFAGAPHPAATEQSARFQLTFLTFSDEEIKAFTNAYPYVFAGEIPAKAYRGQDAAIKTLVSYDALITYKDMSADAIYALTKATFETKESLESLNKTINALDSKDVVKLSVPYHVGALRYYREKGIQIPDRLVPPEGK